MKNRRRIKGFTLESVDNLKEFRSKGLCYRHVKTGCEIYHVFNDDKENLFSFIFKTLPEDSSGIAHIIEHSVLAGSENYPLKDPFVQLLKSSMYTFLNAMTYPDKTVYPASSIIEKDYFNLMEVYGDAVFFPLLEKGIFLQEGIRFEKDSNGKYLSSGVVYNEMKGNYSDHNSVLAEWSLRSLFPDTRYRFDTGGYPDEIKNLKYEKFLEFHKKNYHPSNCRIFLYGNIDTEKQLEYLDSRFLSKFQYMEIDNTVKIQPFKNKPVYIEKHSHSGNGKGTTSITVNWLCSIAANPADSVEMEILSEILMGNPGSPLYLAVVKSGIGEDLAPVSGADTDLRQILFSVGIRGTKAENVKLFEELIEETLQNLVEKGIDRDLIEGTLRIFEFSHREIKGGRPLGLKLMNMSLQGWLHGEKPSHTLCFEKIIKDLRIKLENDNFYFEKLIRKNLLENNHKSIVTVKPAPEDIVLFSDEAELSDEEKQQADSDYEIFVKNQAAVDSPEEIKKIPVLSKKEIPRKVDIIEYDECEKYGAGTLLHSFYTAGITYTSLFMDILPLDEELKNYLPLFSRAVRETGLPGIPYYDTAKLLNLKTGGFYASPETGTKLGSGSMEFIAFHFKSLSERYEEAADFVFKLIKNADFDDLERLKDIIREMTNDYKAHFLRRGNYVASLTASAGFSPSLERQEKWAGLSQFYFLNSINLDDKTAVEIAADKLKKIRSYLISTPDFISCITSEEKDIDRIFSVLEKNLTHEKGLISMDNSGNTLRGAAEYSCITVPAMINFNSTVIPGSRSGTEYFVYEKLLSRIIETGFLWEKVRMEGGAYGVAAVSNGMDGVFSFSSYRDPKIEETQNMFRESLRFAGKGGITEDNLFKAIISGVGREIRPLSPGEKGIISLRRKIYGITDKYRQESRDLLLGASVKDIIEASERLGKGFEKASRCVVAGNESINKYSNYFSSFRCRTYNIEL